MPFKSLLFQGRVLFFLLILAAFQLSHFSAGAQVRQVYVDKQFNHLKGISFYSPSAGFVAFHEWIGFTSDSGRTYSKKFITDDNIDYNGYPLSMLQGFVINGVKAFDQQTLLVYGKWMAQNIVLRSVDGGDHFKVVFHEPYDQDYYDEGIEGLSFPQNGSTGYAIDGKYLLKTVNGGQTWTTLKQHLWQERMNAVQALNSNDIFIYSGSNMGQIGSGKMYRSQDGGNSWTPIALPAGGVRAAFFLTATRGWVNVEENLYQTTDGGVTWTRQNSPVFPVITNKIVFTDDQTGYYINTDEKLDVYKTTDAGKVWEPLPRDNNYSNWYGLSDLHFYDNALFWTGGGYGFLAISTNAGGTPLPRAYFSKDTAGVFNTGIVHLTNYSKPDYTFKWFRNDTLIGTAYHTTYNRTAYPLRDTIMLIVSNGVRSDTAIQYQQFTEPAYITSFSPAAAKTGTTVTINGAHFSEAVGVYFGSVEASSFTIVNSNTITAVVGSGASGSITVVTPFRGTAARAGFTFYPPPSITAFTPLAATAGTSLTITGTNFQDITAVKIGGITVSNYTVVSPTTLTLVVPSGKSGPVEISTKGGVAQLAGFTAIPSINVFAPLIGTEGTILKIRGTSLLDVTGVTIGGLPATTFTIHSADSMTAIVGMGATGSLAVSTGTQAASKPGFTFVNPPAITSVNPLSGPVGTTVTITGSNFKSLPADNIVLFGSLRAAVTASTTNSLTVTVPAGATLHHISVTTNGLTAFASKPFLTTFTGGSTITPNSFVRNNFTTEGPGRTRDYLEKAIADIDGDGKEDILITNAWGAGPADVLLNTFSGNTLSFAPHLEAAASGLYSVLADLDGDGKVDCVQSSDYMLDIYRNTSVTGNLSFPDYHNRWHIVTGPTRYFHNLGIHDVDKDGKTDIVLACQDNMIVLRNTGEPGNISFEKIELPYGGYDMVLADMDQDGKPDIIQFNPAANIITVYKNTSTKGQISFTSSGTLTAASPFTITVGDLNEDGLPDIVAGSQSGNKIEVFRNTSAGNTVAFDTPKELTMPGTTYDVALADLNGDGKLEILASTLQYHFVSFTNLSTIANISFEAPVYHFPGTYEKHSFRFRIHIGDFNADGRPDPVIVDKNVMARLCIYSNEAIGKPFIREFTPAIAAQNTVVTIKGRQFTGVTGVSFGGVAAASYTVVNDTTIQATVGNGATGNVSVISPLGIGEKEGFVFGSIPFIASFSPLSGPVGSRLVLAGSGFDPVPENNVVYFGGVKTTVAAATPHALTIIVPAGAAPGHITVTANGRTAYAGKHFVVTFPGNGSNFSDTSFVRSGTSISASLASVADLDRDGKNDIIALHGQSGVWVARNTSTIGTVSLAPAITLDCGQGGVAAATGDLDGDGYIDVAAVGNSTNNFHVFRNTTAGGTLSFAPGVSHTVLSGFPASKDIAIGDLDGDGRPEIIVVNFEANRFFVFRNLSIPGNITFADPQHYGVNGGTPHGVSCDDVDQDGKLELLVRYFDNSSNATGGVAIFKNTGPNGVLSLANLSTVSSGYLPGSVGWGDLDGDGKTDVAMGTQWGRQFSISKNNSTTGNPQFAYAEYTDVYQLYPSVGISDLDGDGKPELVVDIYNERTVIFKNNSTPGIISLLTGVYTQKVSGAPRFVDVDGDGALDIVDEYGGILLNQMSREAPIELCQDADTSLQAGITSVSYQWQQDTGNGFVDIQDNNHLTGTNSARLRLIDVPSSWQGCKFRCVDNTQQGRVYHLNIMTTGTVPAVSITTPTDTICSNSKITFLATAINGGSTPAYQWLVNNTPVGINANTFGAQSLQDGDEVKVSMTSNAACATGSTVASNTIKVTVRAALQASVTIKATPETGCAQQLISFKATPAHAGILTSYQWIVNDEGVGAQGLSPVLNNVSVRNGDKVKVLMFTDENYGCNSGGMVFSNVITIGSNEPGAPQAPNTPLVNITASATNLCPGETITFTANPFEQGDLPVYQWQVNGLNMGLNSPVFISNALSPGDEIKVIMTGNATCTIGGPVTSNTIKLTAGTPVTPSVDIVSTATSICAGTAITFTAKPVHGGSAPTYQWQVNGVNAGQNSAVFISASLPNEATVRVIMTSSDRCATVAADTSNVITISVTPSPVPAITFAPSSPVICPGEDITFTATPVNGGNAPAYQWQVNGANVGQSSPTFLLQNIRAESQVRVILTSNATCATPAKDTSVSTLVKLNTSGTLAVVAIVGISEVPPNTPVLVTATPINTISPVFQWQDSTATHGWQNIAGATAGSINYTPARTNDAVRCRLTADRPCTGPDTAYSFPVFFTVLGPSGGRIAPNPVEGTLYLDQLQLSDQWETVEIAPVSGGNKLLVRNVENQTRVAIPVYQLPKGLYVAILTSKTGARKQIKFLKQ